MRLAILWQSPLSIAFSTIKFQSFFCFSDFDKGPPQDPITSNSPLNRLSLHQDHQERCLENVLPRILRESLSMCAWHTWPWKHKEVLGMGWCLMSVTDVYQGFMCFHSLRQSFNVFHIWYIPLFINVYYIYIHMYFWIIFWFQWSFCCLVLSFVWNSCLNPLDQEEFWNLEIRFPV